VTAFNIGREIVLYVQQKGLVDGLVNS